MTDLVKVMRITGLGHGEGNKITDLGHGKGNKVTDFVMRKGISVRLRKESDVRLYPSERVSRQTLWRIELASAKMQLHADAKRTG